MTAGVPPDGYLRGSRAFAPVIAQLTGAAAEAIGEYVIVVQMWDDDPGMDVIVSPGLDIGELPAALRDLADSLDRRSARLLS